MIKPLLNLIALILGYTIYMISCMSNINAAGFQKTLIVVAGYTFIMAIAISVNVRWMATIHLKKKLHKKKKESEAAEIINEDSVSDSSVESDNK